MTCDPEFINLPVEEVEKIISSDSLSVESEEEVYQAVMKWAKAEPERANDGSLLYQLLQHVRLPLAKPQFLLDVVQLEPLIKRNRFGYHYYFKKSRRVLMFWTRANSINSADRGDHSTCLQ